MKINLTITLENVPDSVTIDNLDEWLLWELVCKNNLTALSNNNPLKHTSINEFIHRDGVGYLINKRNI